MLLMGVGVLAVIRPPPVNLLNTLPVIVTIIPDGKLLAVLIPPAVGRWRWGIKVPSIGRP